jgi:hypothetical protein
LHFASRELASAFFLFHSVHNLPICPRLGEIHVRKAFDFNQRAVDYDTSSVAMRYVNSCICASSGTHPSLRTSPPPSLYMERKQELEMMIKQMQHLISLESQELAEKEAKLLKYKKELDLINQILNL